MKGITNMANKTDKVKEPKAKRDYSQIKGVFMLLVVMSAIYAIATIVLGTGEEILPKVLISPLALWVLCELTKRFTK